MQTEQKIFKNTVILSAGKGFGDLCSFVFIAYFGRIFGAEILGKYSFAMSLGGLLTILASFGFNTLLIREVSKNEHKSATYVGNLLLMRGGLSLLIWGLIIIGSLKSNLPDDTKMILIFFSGYHIFYRLTGLLRASFKAHDQMHYSGILEFYHKIVILLLGTTSILIFYSPTIALSSYPIASISMFIIALVIYKTNHGFPEFTVNYSFIKDSIRKAFPFFVIIVIGQFYDRIGIIFLTFLKGEHSTGIFWSSDRLLVTLYAGMNIFSGVLFPYMAKLSTDTTDQLYQLCQRALRFLFVVLLSVSIVIYIFSDQIILTIFGEKFSSSEQVLKLLIWSYLLMGLNQIISILMIVTYKEKILMQMRAIAYFGYCGVSLFFIWKFDYIGLAFAKILIEGILFLVILFYAFPFSEMGKLVRNFLAPLSSSLVCLILFHILDDFNAFITIPFVFGLYIALLFLLKGVFVHDFKFMGEIIFGKRE